MAIGADAGNPFLYTAVGLSAAGLLGAIYLPGLRDLLGTTALHPSELGLSQAVGALPAVLIETTKAVTDARSRDKSGTAGVDRPCLKLSWLASIEVPEPGRQPW